MKKLILAWALFSVISCGGSDEDQDLGNKASIIGKWSVEKAEIYKSSNQQILTSYSTDCQKTGTYEFTPSHLISISYADNNNTCVKTDVSTRKYTFDEGDGKFWFENEEKYPSFITKLTASDLVIEDRMQDFDGDGTKDVLRR